MEVRKWCVLLSYLTQTLRSSQGTNHQPSTLHKLPSFSPFYKQYWHNINSAHKIPKTDSSIINNVVETNYSNPKNDVKYHELSPSENSEVVNSNIDLKDVSEINSTISILDVPTQIESQHVDNASTNVTTPVNNESKTKNLTLKRLKDYHSIFNNITSFKDHFDKLKLKHGSKINNKGNYTEKVQTSINKITENNDVLPKIPSEPQNVATLLKDKDSKPLALQSNVTENYVNNEVEENSKDSGIKKSSALQTINVDAEMKNALPVLGNPIQLQKTKSSADYEAILAKIRSFKAFSSHKNHALVANISSSNQIVTPDSKIQPQVVLTPQTTHKSQQSIRGQKNHIPVTDTYPLEEILVQDNKSHSLVAPPQSTIIEQSNNDDSYHKPVIPFKSFGNISPDIFYKLRQQLHSKKAPTTKTSIASKSDNSTQEEVAKAEIIINQGPQIVEDPSSTLPNKVEHNPLTSLKEIQPLYTHIDHTIEQPERNHNVPAISETLTKVIVDSPTIVRIPNDDYHDLSKEAPQPPTQNYVDPPKNLTNDLKIEKLSNIPNAELHQLLIALNQLVTTPVYEGDLNVNTKTNPKNAHSNGNLVSNPIKLDSLREVYQAPVQNENNSLDPITTTQKAITNIPLSPLHKLDQISLPELVALRQHAEVNREIQPIDISKPISFDNVPIILTEPKNFGVINSELVSTPLVYEESGIQINSPQFPETSYAPTHNPPTLTPRIINIDAILANLQNKEDRQLNRALEFLLLSDLLNKKLCNPKIVKTLLTLLYLR